RRRAHEPREMTLVLGMVIAVGTLRAVGVRPLKINVRSHGEPDPYNRVTGLKQIAAAIARSRRRRPRFHEVVDERIIGPLRDFVAEYMDVLRRPGSSAVRLREQTRGKVRSPDESLHGLIAVAVVLPSVRWRLVCAVETGRADLERIATVKQGILC